MKYAVGDKVKIKNNLILDKEYSMNDEKFKHVVVDEMLEFQEEEAIITLAETFGYEIDIDEGVWGWTDQMFE